MPADPIDPLAMASCWRGKWFNGTGYHYFAQLDSTNSAALLLARQGARAGTLVATDCQTRGRGRLNRVWVAPAGKNLSFSLILRPDLKVAAVQRLTLLAGVALADAVAGLGVAGHTLKWPNDLYLGGRKVAGILTEAASIGDLASFVVVGVGVNVNGRVEEFPPELRSKVTSLSRHMGRRFSRARLLGGFLACFEYWYGCWERQGFLPVQEAWLGYWAAKGQPVQVVRQGVAVSGIAIGLDDSGHLLMQLPGEGVLAVSSGEVLTMDGGGEHAAGG